MVRKHNRFNFAFPLLIFVIISLFSLSLGFSWQTGREWMESIWLICQNGLSALTNHLPPAGLLLLPALIIVMAIRAGWIIKQQIQSTQKLTRAFLPLKQTPPLQLLKILETQQISASKLIYLDLSVARAFCGGFLRPQIWITSGMVNLLSTEELEAVLTHEAYHYHRRDPLRLLIARAVKAAFFFLPVVKSLADAIELQQETAADQAAITHLGHDLPLLTALQKLLTQKPASPYMQAASVSLFNVTEARLRRLINLPRQIDWRKRMYAWMVSLSIIVFLSLSMLPFSPTSDSYVEHITPCEINASGPFETTLPFLN